MLLHVREAKGNVPRDIPLSPALRERLRVYYRWRKPTDWLFPSKQRRDLPLDNGTIRTLCRNAGRRARRPLPGAPPAVPPRLRHPYASSLSIDRRNRHCPKCHSRARDQWLAARAKEVLSVPYCHLISRSPMNWRRWPCRTLVWSMESCSAPGPSL